MSKILNFSTQLKDLDTFIFLNYICTIEKLIRGQEIINTKNMSYIKNRLYIF